MCSPDAGFLLDRKHGRRVWSYQNDRKARWFDTERERMNMNKDIFWQIMEETKDQELLETLGVKLVQ
ncbi:hypothetical protein FMM80_01285 [Schaedlerella arabinosiphila]|uniref:Uncharacterized protein n=1 Tax=Schaedlerella arabinosiphila TaxID=2044587 RepID=A0A9X5C3W1_9FIRM|nr:hypothetical protein [Schaedlerella arabinosiphila]NDO67440.1 hypothetical protein [Schaedlerella arabinosiphila]